MTTDQSDQERDLTAAPGISDELEPVEREAADEAEPGDDDALSAPDDGGEAEQEAETDWAELAAGDPRSRAELLAELTEAESRRDEYLDSVQRARAELDNFRKRTMRESGKQRELGRADVAESLLDVLDDFDRTLEVAGESGDEALSKGVEMVYGKLVDVLKSHGLERIDESGVAFDPNRHEAVQRVDAEDGLEDPVVDEVFRPGYALDGRVLRPAMVVVRQ